MSIRVVTPQVVWLLDLPTAKAQLNVDFDDDNALITAYIKGSQRQIESMTQRRYGAQVLEWVVDRWTDSMVLPIAPGGDSSKISITSVTYADLNGAPQVLDPSFYWDAPRGPTREFRRRWFAVYPWLGDAAERVVIRITITSTPDDASPSALDAMRLLVAHKYAHREAVVGVDNRDSSAPLPFGVEECVDDDRWDA